MRNRRANKETMRGYLRKPISIIGQSGLEKRPAQDEVGEALPRRGPRARAHRQSKVALWRAVAMRQRLGRWKVGSSERKSACSAQEAPALIEPPCHSAPLL